MKYVIASDRRERRNLFAYRGDYHVAIAPRNDRVFEFFHRKSAISYFQSLKL